MIIDDVGRFVYNERKYGSAWKGDLIYWFNNKPVRWGDYIFLNLKFIIEDM